MEDSRLTGNGSSNAFKITPDGTITEIMSLNPRPSTVFSDSYALMEHSRPRWERPVVAWIFATISWPITLAVASPKSHDAIVVGVEIPKDAEEDAISPYPPFLF